MYLCKPKILSGFEFSVSLSPTPVVVKGKKQVMVHGSYLSSEIQLQSWSFFNKLRILKKINVSFIVKFCRGKYNFIHDTFSTHRVVWPIIYPFLKETMNGFITSRLWTRVVFLFFSFNKKFHKQLIKFWDWFSVEHIDRQNWLIWNRFSHWFYYLYFENFVNHAYLNVDYYRLFHCYHIYQLLRSGRIWHQVSF